MLIHPANHLKVPLLLLEFVVESLKLLVLRIIASKDTANVLAKVHFGTESVIQTLILAVVCTFGVIILSRQILKSYGV